METTETKRCPACAKKIPAGALKCLHCDHVVGTPAPPASAGLGGIIRKGVQLVDKAAFAIEVANRGEKSARPGPPAIPPPAVLDMSATKRCPACAEEILAAAVKCKHCGHMIGAPTGTKRQTHVIAVSLKSVALAAVLPLIIGPLGLLYSAPFAALLFSLIGYPIVLATFGVGALVIFPLSALWGAMSAAGHNASMQRMARR